MPASIRVSGVTFTKVIASLTLPDLNNLALEVVLGGDESKSITNRANPANPLTTVGTPVYAPYYVGLSGGNFAHNGFDTGYVPQGDVTIITICSVPGNNSFSPIQGLIGGQTILGIEVFPSSMRFFNSQWSAPPDNPSVNVSGQGGNFCFFAGTGALGQPGIAYFISGDADDPTIVKSTGTSSGGARNSGAPLSIGTAATGGGNAAYVCIFDRVLTEAQLVAVRASLLSFYAGKITIF
jgi:hypothetical protein